MGINWTNFFSSPPQPLQQPIAKQKNWPFCTQSFSMKHVGWFSKNKKSPIAMPLMQM
jgi:hypothetical protein